MEDKKEKKPLDEAEMLRAVEAWVKQFRSSKDAARAAGGGLFRRSDPAR
jgi:hypothetical protein